MLLEKLAELTGQRNAIDARIVDIVAEIDGDRLWGNTGCRSVAALVAWKTGSSSTNAHTITAVASRSAEFPRCVAGLREGRLSLDQVGVIAERASGGSDEHYAALAEVATVSQLRTAIKLEPQPDPEPQPERERSITKTSDGHSTTWKITLPKLDAAKFDAALQSHQDALIAEWKRDHDDDRRSPNRPPLPGAGEAFLRLVETELGRRRRAPPTWAAHDRGDARRREGPHRRSASGPAAVGFRTPIPDLRRHLRSVVPPRRAGHRRRAGDPGDQPQASSRPRAPPPHLCGARMWCYPRTARPPHRALGRRRRDRTRQPRPGLPVSPPTPPSTASSPSPDPRTP